jgi:hypothetical protein
MATYSADITKNIEPAMANPSTLARAAEANAAAVRTLADTAGSMYKGYVEGELANIEQQGATLQQEFFISNQAASVAGRQAAGMEQQRPQAGGMFAETMLGAQGAEAQSKAVEMLKGFDSELDRLKMASEGGMTNEQYVSRVDSLTKSAIAKFPGLANQIRDRVGTTTGLPSADRWAQMNYVKERFSVQKEAKQKSPEDLALLDIKAASETGLFGTNEELFTLYRTDRPKYDEQMRGFKEYQTAKTQTEVVKNNVTGLQGQSDLQVDANRASFMAVFSGGLGTSVLTSTVQDKENIFGTTLNLMSQGKNVSVDIVPFKTQIDLHAAQMRTNIDGAKRQTYATIDAYLANNPNVSDSKRKELYADVDRAASAATARYADDKGIGLVAMANILKTYRDKSLAEKTQLVDLAIKQQTAMQNNPMVMAYWAGGESRENLKRTNRSFFEFMAGQEQELTSSIFGVRNDIKAATDLANVQRVVVQAGQDPAAVPVDPLATPGVTRAAHQTLMATANEVLKKAELNQVEINTVSAALSTSAVYGANSLLLAKDYRKIGEKIEKLSDPDKAIIKSNVSNSVKQAVINVQDIKATIESKYKTKLTLGVNDAGEISVIVPQQQATSLTNRPLVSGSGFNVEAAAEFMKQAKPILNNMVFGRSMLTKEEPKVSGSDFATIINNNQSYNGFFQSQAQPVAAPATQQSSAGSLKVGDVVNGYRYNGGDANSESSWSKQ